MGTRSVKILCIVLSRKEVIESDDNLVQKRVAESSPECVFRDARYVQNGRENVRDLEKIAINSEAEHCD